MLKSIRNAKIQAILPKTVQIEGLPNNNRTIGHESVCLVFSSGFDNLNVDFNIIDGIIKHDGCKLPLDRTGGL